MASDAEKTNGTVIQLPGTVTNGVIVLSDGATVPEGTRVQVLVPVSAEEAASPLGRRLLGLAGIANELPSDMAAQHDHYLHGRPKR
jgi:hypothetical protein